MALARRTQSSGLNPQSAPHPLNVPPEHTQTLKMHTFKLPSGAPAIWLCDEASKLPVVAAQLVVLGFVAAPVIDGLDVLECRVTKAALTFSLSWDIWDGLVFFPYEPQGGEFIPLIFDHLRSVGW